MGRARAGRGVVAVLAAAAAALVAPSAALAGHQPLGEVDKRAGVVEPTPEQRAMVKDLSATVRWNEFGTPRSLMSHDDDLATGVEGADAAAAARAWLAANAELFRLASTDGLRTVAESRLGEGEGWVVTLAQRFGDLEAVADGLVTVGLRRAGATWNVVYASSTLTGDRQLAEQPSVSAVDAWLAAAWDVGRSAAAADVVTRKRDEGWTVLAVKGFSEPQRARHGVIETRR